MTQIIVKRKIESQNVNFDFCPLKIKNCPELHACKKHATCCWKTFNNGYNFALVLTSIRALHKKLWASKMTKVPILGIVGSIEKNVICV